MDLSKQGLGSLDFSVFLSKSPQIIWKVNPSLQMNYVSENVKDILGYDSKEIINNLDFWFNSAHPADRKNAIQRFRDLFNGKKLKKIVYRLQRKSGDYIWVECLPLMRSKEDDNFFLTMVDITEQKKLENKLKESEENYRNLIDNASESFFVIKEDMIVFCNKSFLTTLKVEKSDVINTKFIDWIKQQDRLRVVDFLSKTLIKSKKGLVFSMLDKHGNEFKGELRCTKVIYYDEPALQCILRNVTQKYKAEEKIISEKERAEKYLDLAGNMIVALDCDGKIKMINKKGYKILGYNPNELNDKNWFDTCIPKNERKDVKNIFSKFTCEKKSLVEFYETEVLTKSGERRLIMWNNKFIQNSKGDITGTISSGHDITDERRAQRTIRVFKEGFDASPNSMLLVEYINKKPIIRMVNDSFTKLYGFKPKEVIGKNPNLIKSGIQSKEYYEKMWETILDPEIGGWRDEIKNKAKDGRLIDIILSISTIFDANNNPSFFIAHHVDISKRTAAQEELQLFRDVLENASEGVFIIDSKGWRIIDANERACKSLGYSKKELLKKSLSDIEKTIPKDNRVNGLNKLKKKSKWLVKEGLHIRKDGSEFPVEVTSNFTSRKGEKYLVILVKDISEKKKTESELQKSEKKFRILTDISPASITIYNEKKLIYFNKATEKISGYSAKELKKKHFWSIIHPDFKKSVHKRAMQRLKGKSPIGKYPIKILTKQGKSRWVQIGAAPLEIEGESVVMATAIDTTDRMNSELALKSSEENYRLLAETTSDAIMVIKHDGIIQYVNPAFKDLTNKKKSEVLNTKLSTHLSKKSAIIAKQMQMEMAKGKLKMSRGFVAELLDKKGNMIPVEVSTSTIMKDSKFTGVVAVIRDVTERTMLDLELKKSESMYKTMIKTSPIAITISDLNTRIIDCSHTASKIFGYGDSRGMIGQNSFKYIHKKDHARVRKDIKSVLKYGIMRNRKYTFVRKDDSVFQGYLNCSLIKDNLENPKGFIVTVEDISKDKIKEAELFRSREIYKNTLKVSPFSTLLIDLKGHIMEASNKTAENHGYSDTQELIDKNIKDLICIKERKKVLSMINNIIKKGYLKRINGMLLRKNDTEYMGEISASLLKDSDGKPFAVNVIFRDITKEKNYEKIIKSSEEKFKQLAEKSPNMIFINHGGKMVYVNNACVKIMGYSKKEFYSPDFQFTRLIHKDYRKKSFMNLRKHQKGREVKPTEYKILTKKGNVIDSLINTKLIDYEDEKAILGMITDISVQKEIEVMLKEKEGIYSTILDNFEDVIIMHDFKGNISYANNKTALTFEYTDEKILKLNMSKLLPKSSFKLALWAFKRLKKDKHINFEIEFKKSNGKLFLGYVSSSILKLNKSYVIQTVIKELNDKSKFFVKR